MDVRVGLSRKLSAEELMLLNCGVWNTLESPLDCKEIQPVHPKGNQSWIFIGRTDFEAETPILWPPDAKNWLIGKDPDAGKDWRWEEKGMTEDEMVGWHHRLNGREYESTPGVGDQQGGLACCHPWSCKELDTTEQLSWTALILLNSRHLSVHRHQVMNRSKNDYLVPDNHRKIFIQSFIYSINKSHSII